MDRWTDLLANRYWATRIMVWRVHLGRVKVNICALVGSWDKKRHTPRRDDELVKLHSGLPSDPDGDTLFVETGDSEPSCLYGSKRFDRRKSGKDMMERKEEREGGRNGRERERRSAGRRKKGDMALER